ncbi:hypothetical protein ABT218_10875, partial [Streptomyces sp. NPDC001455]
MTNATRTTAERGHLAGRREWTASAALLPPLLLVSMDMAEGRPVGPAEVPPIGSARGAAGSAAPRAGPLGMVGA